MKAFVIRSIISATFATMWVLIASATGMKPRVLDWWLFFAIDYAGLKQVAIERYIGMRK